MNPMKEIDYGYEYPIKAMRYNEWEIDVRKMRPDEMPDDGITYYCDVNSTIYHEGEKDFKLLTTNRIMKEELKIFLEGEKDKWIKIFDYHSDVSNERHTIMRMVARVEIDYFDSKIKEILLQDDKDYLKNVIDNTEVNII